jgi:hypothetical protein
MVYVWYLYKTKPVTDIMSKKHNQMDKHFQIWNGIRIFKSDLIDFYSEIDETLYFPENLQQLKTKFGYDKHGTY